MCPEPKHKMHKCTAQCNPESFFPPQLNVEATLCTKSWLYGFEDNLIFFYSHNYTILILY